MADWVGIQAAFIHDSGKIAKAIANDAYQVFSSKWDLTETLLSNIVIKNPQDEWECKYGRYFYMHVVLVSCKWYKRNLWDKVPLLCDSGIWLRDRHWKERGFDWIKKYQSPAFFAISVLHVGLLTCISLISSLLVLLNLILFVFITNNTTAW